MENCGDNSGESLNITESGIQLLNRLERRKALSGLEPALFPEDFETGTVIEITGEAGIGKSELLLHFVVKCILPVSWRSYHLGGFQVGVIFFDNDHHLYLPRIIHLLEESLSVKLIKEGAVPSEEEVQKFVMECLGLLRIVRCWDSAQFMLTLQYMNAFASSKYDCCLLIIDSISAFYYEDRMLKSDNLSRLAAYYKQLANILQRFVDSDKFIVFFTRQDLIKTATNKSMEDFLNEELYFMGYDLQRLVSWRILLSKEAAHSDIITANIGHRTSFWNQAFTIVDSGINFDVQSNMP